MTDEQRQMSGVVCTLLFLLPSKPPKFSRVKQRALKVPWGSVVKNSHGSTAELACPALYGTHLGRLKWLGAVYDVWLCHSSVSLLGREDAKARLSGDCCLGPPACGLPGLFGLFLAWGLGGGRVPGGESLRKCLTSAYSI